MSKDFIVHLMVTLSSLALGACGTPNDVSYNQKTQAPLPPITEMDAAMSKPVPQAAITNIETPEAKAQKALQTHEQRIAELEATVQSLRADYDRIMPAFASLNTTNERIQSLLDELEVQGKLAGQDKMDVPAANPSPKEVMPSKAPMGMKIPSSEDDQAMMAPEPSVTPVVMNKPVVATSPAPSKAESSITAVRIGEHGTKTRLVFDLDAKSKPQFTYDLDNQEKLLLVEMPTSSWVGKESGMPKSPLIGGWSVQRPQTGGSVVAVQLKKDARVLSTEFIQSQGKDPSKLVIDIASGS